MTKPEQVLLPPILPTILSSAVFIRIYHKLTKNHRFKIIFYQYCFWTHSYVHMVNICVTQETLSSEGWMDYRKFSDNSQTFLFIFKMGSILNHTICSSTFADNVISSLLAINIIEGNWCWQASLVIVYENRLNTYWLAPNSM